MTAKAARVMIAGTAAHGAVIAALHRDCFGEPWSVAAVAAILAKPASFGLIACADRRAGQDPLGFVLCQSAADECEIISLGVLPAARRQGIARRLVDAALAAAAGYGIVAMFLEVGQSNTAARMLYGSCGFRQAGRRRGYYKRVDGPEDALIYRRSIAARSGDARSGDARSGF